MARPPMWEPPKWPYYAGILVLMLVIAIFVIAAAGLTG